eukprot:1192435-Prorocentrum_minimum.AAC.5
MSVSSLTGRVSLSCAHFPVPLEDAERIIRRTPDPATAACQFALIPCRFTLSRFANSGGEGPDGGREAQGTAGEGSRRSRACVH